MSFPFEDDPTLLARWSGAGTPNHRLGLRLRSTVDFGRRQMGLKRPKAKGPASPQQPSGVLGDQYGPTKANNAHQAGGGAEDGGGLGDQNVKTSSAQPVGALKAPPKEDPPSYLQQLKRVGPGTLFKAVADMPGAALEKHVENKIIGTDRLPTAPKRINPMSRSVGRSVGHLARLGTAPVFFSGMKDVQSKDPAEKKRGIAKVLASASLSGFGKGAIEAAIEKAKPLRAGISKALVSMPAAGVALYTSKKTGEVEGKKKYLLGALIGSASGVVQGGIEAAATNRAFRLSRPASYRRAILGSMAGKGAEGLLAGTLLTGLIHHFTKKPKDKKP